MPESTRVFHGISHLDTAIDAVKFEIWGCEASFSCTPDHWLHPMIRPEAWSTCINPLHDFLAVDASCHLFRNMWAVLHYIYKIKSLGSVCKQ